MALVQDLLTERAAADPQAPAIVARGGTLSYAELDARSNQMARLIREAGCRRGDRIGILSPPAPAAVVALLAVLKADGIAVPLDPAWAPERLARIEALVEPRGVVAAPEEGRRWRASGGARVLEAWWDASGGAARAAAGAWGSLSAAPLGFRNRPSNPAMILGTPEGDALAPRGVVVTHADLQQAVRWMNGELGTGPGDRQVVCAPPGTGRSVLEVVGALAAGATLHVPDRACAGVAAIAAFVEAAELTQWFADATVVEALADAPPPHGRLHALRRLVWCGRPPAAAALGRLARRLGHVHLVGLYGAAETTLATAACRRWPADATPVPLGRPRPGQRFRVLDPGLVPVAPGGTGDLFIEGVGLSPGYWRDVDATAAAFVVDRRDGSAERLFRTGQRARLDHDGEVYLVSPTADQGAAGRVH